MFRHRLKNVMAAVVLLLVSAPGHAAHHLVTYATADGGHIEGALFPVKSKPLVAVFAHGAVFDKESWYPLARHLQDKGIASLAIDFRDYGKSTGPAGGLYHDLLGAVGFLEHRGYHRIALVGGSMGGAAVLTALQHTQDPHIVKAVLLAPAGGAPLSRPHLQKLFIVSRGDGLHSTVKSLCDQSASPKRLVVLPGSAHAQHIFATDQAGPLRALITRFLTRPTP